MIAQTADQLRAEFAEQLDQLRSELSGRIDLFHTQGNESPRSIGRNHRQEDADAPQGPAPRKECRRRFSVGVGN
jgi:hypothetical protein